MPTPSILQSWRASRWFKPVAVIFILLVLLLFGGLLLPRLIDINSYRGQLVAQIEKQLGRSVQLGHLSLRVLPSIKVKAENVAIADDPQFAQGSFVTARSVQLRIGLWSLLRGNPQLQGIELIEPAVTLIKAGEQKWNWGTLKPLQEPQAKEETPPFDLAVSQGRFTLIDRTINPATEAAYSGVSLSLDDFSPKRSFDFSVGLTMPGEKGGQLELKGETGPIDATDLALTPVKARVIMNQVDITALENLAGIYSPRAGLLTVDVELWGKLAEKLQANGTVKAENLRLVLGVEPAQTPLEAKFKLTSTSPRAASSPPEYNLLIEEGELSLGKTRLNLSGQINRLPAHPTLDLQVKGDGMALDSLLESAYAFGFGPPPGTKAAGAADLDLHVVGELPKPSLEGKASVRNLRFESASLPQAIEVSELKANFNPQLIAVAPFRTALGSRSTLEVNQLTIANYTQTPRIRLECNTSNAQLDDLLKMAESFGVRPDLKGTGTVTLRATVETNIGSETSAMNVQGQGKLSGGSLQTSQLTKPIQVSNTDLNFSGDSARLDNIAAIVGSSAVNGWLQVKDFDRPALTFDLRANQLIVSELQSLVASQAGASSGSTAGMSADGQLAVGKLLLDSLTATDVLAKLTMRNQIVTLDPITLNLYGGGYQGSARINQASATPEVGLQGKLNGVDIHQFLSATKQTGMIYGRLDGSIDLRGRGDDADSFAKSLLGNGQILISNGKFTSFDLMKQVEVLGRLANLPTGGAGTAFRSLKTNLTFEKGVMRTDALQLVMDDLVATGNGLLRLGEPMSMDYSILAKLSPAVSKRVLPQKQTDGTTALSGGIMGTIVGNFFMEKDSLAVPLKISGPLSQPSFGLDSNILQQRAKSSLMENLQKRIFGKPEDQQQQPQTEEKKKQPTPQDALKGILDRLKKKPN